jgi:hypothetical protein
MRMYDRGLGAVAKLMWSAPGLGKEVIPPSAVSPGRPDLVVTNVSVTPSNPVAGEEVSVLRRDQERRYDGVAVGTVARGRLLRGRAEIRLVHGALDGLGAGRLGERGGRRRSERDPLDGGTGTPTR